MRKKYERLTDQSAKHNELHRLCFETPYLLREVSSVPTTDQLDGGELVFCTADDKLYYKKVSGTVVKTSALG